MANANALLYLIGGSPARPSHASSALPWRRREGPVPGETQIRRDLHYSQGVLYKIFKKIPKISDLSVFLAFVCFFILTCLPARKYGDVDQEVLFMRPYLPNVVRTYKIHIETFKFEIEKYKNIDRLLKSIMFLPDLGNFGKNV